ncbi:phosphatidylinositol-glycan biosynthesis class W protein-like isoform X2 [Schistocerca gregaria]|uniref:phosphatidylinositol-glycan biosynthesis class W protein-like isoform X2 n=1 Tax=Schistocerca gregaria TaxID=7010 RepID=UPI00211E839F|nr:phosphatidylinositol-glycan biosynthesis class W protein-like isoform X2 [Schistocerca gregaria]
MESIVSFVRDFINSIPSQALTESIGLMLCGPAYMLVYRTICALTHGNDKKFSAGPLDWILNYACTILPFIITFSYLAYLRYYIILLGLELATFFMALNPAIRKTEDPIPREWCELDRLNDKRKNFIKNIRENLVVATCVAILAVDFPAYFPVRLSKSSVYGASIMDFGVSSFVFMNGITTSKGEMPNLKRIKNSLKSSLKTIIMIACFGIQRLIYFSIIGFDRVSVKEYGVHWNFYFTLCVLITLGCIIQLPPVASFLLGFVVLLVYQYSLTLLNLGEFIVSAPRTNLFSKNREGILSCISFFSMICVLRIVAQIFRKPRSKTGWWLVALTIFSITLGSWMLGFFFESRLNILSSRRMCNVPYILYTITLCMFVLFFHLVIDLILPVYRTPLTDAITTSNTNQLIFFVLIPPRKPSIRLYLS